MATVWFDWWTSEPGKQFFDARLWLQASVHWPKKKHISQKLFTFIECLPMSQVFIALPFSCCFFMCKKTTERLLMVKVQVLSITPVWTVLTATMRCQVSRIWWNSAAIYEPLGSTDTLGGWLNSTKKIEVFLSSVLPSLLHGGQLWFVGQFVPCEWKLSWWWSYRTDAKNVQNETPFKCILAGLFEISAPSAKDLLFCCSMVFSSCAGAWPCIHFPSWYNPECVPVTES